KEWPTHKIESEMSPEIHLSEDDLDAIINVEEIQSIMDDFHHLTNMVTAILDLKGQVIEATGWQDICTNPHARGGHNEG
ncbi:MAG: PocR ligand-binding domain-containing protein, partial [Desulfatirhabdiaceae bacterium]|nr:PocR ligand-binding domain-containing protein [Desulfatirhabdiaceae bacterium]